MAGMGWMGWRGFGVGVRLLEQGPGLLEEVVGIELKVGFQELGDVPITGMFGETV
jgi:hypothetical protein